MTDKRRLDKIYFVRSSEEYESFLNELYALFDKLEQSGISRIEALGFVELAREYVLSGGYVYDDQEDEE